MSKQLAALGRALGGSDERVEHLREFYEILEELARRTGGRRSLADCSGRLSWPLRGVYFFFEDGESRSDSGQGPRVVRVGTHALKTGAKSTLWNRLSQHRGSARTGGGNHRGSIFRLLVGEALLGGKLERSCRSWGRGSSAESSVRAAEHPVEEAVSRTIGAMAVLGVRIDDDPGPGSLRGEIERNAIALLSNFQRSSRDARSRNWLGLRSGREQVRRSGLWNVKHVDEDYDPRFLRRLREIVKRTERLG